MLKQLIDVTRFGKAKKRKRDAIARRRLLHADVHRSLEVEPLEGRLLLASDVTIGSTNDGTSYLRVVDGTAVTYSPTTDSAQIGDSNILTDLDAGMTVIVDTVNPAGTEQGNLILTAADLSLSMNVDASIELRADNDVLLQSAVIVGSSGTISMTLNSDRDQSGEGRVEIDNSSILDSGGAAITIGGGADPTTMPARGNTLEPDGVSIFGDVISGAGNVSVRGAGLSDVSPAADADGILIEGNVDSTTGDITLTGTGGNTTGSGNEGIAFDFGVVATTSGNISLTGVGGGTGNASNGITLNSGGFVTAASGSITVSGTGSPTGTGIGVLIATESDVIESIGSAPISITAVGSNGSSGLQSSGAIGGVTASGDITLETDGLELLGGAAFVEGTGNLTIRPVDPAQTIGVGGAAAGTLNLSDTELTFFSDGFAGVTIGDALNGTGAVAIDGPTFLDPVTLVGGSISVANGISGDGGITLTARDAATAGQDVVVSSGTVDDSSGDVTINAGDDVTLVTGAAVVAGSTGATAEIRVDSTPDVDVNTGSTVNLAGSFFGDGGQTITGGADADTISIQSGPLDLGVTTSGADSGTIRTDGVTTSYSGIDAINSLSASDNVNLTFGSVGETLTLSQPSASTLGVVSSAGQAITIATPNSSLTIDTGMGGADTVNVAALNVALPLEFTIQDGDEVANDEVNLNGAITNTTGGLEVTALNIDVNGDLNLAGALDLGSSGASGLITLATENISAGFQFYQSAVELADFSPAQNDTIQLASTGAPILFFDSINAAVANNLVGLAVLADAGVDIVGPVGDTRPIFDLVVDVDSGVITLSGDMNVTSDQTYFDPVEVNGSIQFTGEYVSFRSTLDESVPDQSDVSIVSSGVQFVGDVGGLGRLRSLDVDAGEVSVLGPQLELPALVSTLNDLSLRVGDSVSAAANDLDVPSGTTLLSSVGNISLSAGDNLNIDPAATIDAEGLSILVDQPIGTADPEGGTANIAGTTERVGTIAVSGGNEADSFRFSPDVTNNINFVGGTPDSSPGDSVIVDANGRFVVITDSQITMQISDFDQAVGLAGIESVTLLNASSTRFDGGAGDDTFTIAAASVGSPASVVSFDNGLAVTTDAGLRIVGNAGADSMVFDLTNGIPAQTVDASDFDGGTAIDPLDELVILGTPPTPIDTLRFGYVTENDGDVSVDGMVLIRYGGIAPITSTVDAVNVVLEYDAVAETIDLSQVAGDITVDSTNGEITTFVAPTGSLQIDTGGGADTVNVEGLNVSLTSGFSVVDPDASPDDTVRFQNIASTVGVGIVDVVAVAVEVLQNLSADGGIFLGVGTGNGEIRPAANLTSLGDIVLNEPVNLLGATTVTSGASSQVSFPFSVNGTQDLIVNGGNLVEFLSDVGNAPALNSLNVTAGAGVITFARGATTLGTQSFNSPVNTDGGGSIVEFQSSNGESISFASSIDTLAMPADSLAILTSTGAVALGGSIGSPGSPFDTVDILAGQSLTIGFDVDVINNLFVTISESSGADDDLVISSPAVITSTSGNVDFLVGDDIDLQSGATILAPSGQLILAGDNPLGDLDALGSTIRANAVITTSLGTSLTGGQNEDAFAVTPQSGTSFSISGDDPTTLPGDTLAIDASGMDTEIDLGSGAITISGAQPIDTTGLETVTLSNVATLTLTGTSADEDVSIRADSDVVGGDLLTLPNLPVIAISAIENLVFNGDLGDDRFSFDAVTAFPTVPVMFNGQGQNGLLGGDALSVLGSFGTQTFNYTAPTVDGNSGTVDLDGTVITYTGLEPISGGDSVDTVFNLDTGLMNNAALLGGSGDDSVQLFDRGMTFETTDIPNPSNSLTIHLGDQGDVLEVDTLSANFAASVIVQGGTGFDDVFVVGVSLDSTPGRGLDVVAVETLEIVSSSFSNNTADVGAGLRVVGGSTRISNSSFTGNIATGDDSTQGGGGIFADSDLLIDSDTFIDNNSAIGRQGSGGGILIGSSGTLTIDDATISNNTANRAGGGIEIQSGNTVDLLSVLLQNNVAGPTFVSAAPGNGGGLHVTGDANVNLDNVSVIGNFAAAEGGGLWNDLGTMTLFGGTTVDSNVAAGDADPNIPFVELFHFGDTDPTFEGWTVTVDPGNAVGPVTNDPGFGRNSWTTDDNSTTPPSVANYEIQLSAAEQAEANSLGWAYFAEIRLADVPEPTLGTAIQYDDGSGTTYAVFLGTDAVGDPIVELLGEAPFTLTGFGGGYHQYDLFYDAFIGEATLFVDGVNVFSGYQGAGTGLNASAVSWGALSDDRQGQANFAFIDFQSQPSGRIQGGGGIFNNGGSLILDDATGAVTVSGNQASGESFGSGGGILSLDGNVDIIGATITLNEAVRAGGGIEIVEGSVTITSSDVSLNDVSFDDLLGAGLGANPGNGGGLHITGSADVTIDGSLFNGNTAEAEGGGLWNSGSGTLTIIASAGSTEISGNVARGDAAPGADGSAVQGGGGLFNNGGSVSIDGAGGGVTISSNAATGPSFGSGGGLLSIGGSVDIADTQIESNEAVRAGGGVEVVSGSMTLFQVDVIDNDVSDDDLLLLGLGASPGNGGGLHITADASVLLESTNVSGNTAEAEGGGLWNSATGTLTLDGAINGGDITIDGNEARGDAAAGVGNTQLQGGGGIFNNGGALTIRGDADSPNVFVTNNAASGSTNGSGGGILSTGGVVNVSETIFDGNSAVRAGGGIELVDGSASVINSALTFNEATDGDGGGLHVTGIADVFIGFTTVMNNSASREGGGLWNSTGTMTLENRTIVDGNIASGDAADEGGGGIFNNGGTLVITDNTTSISGNTADGISGSGGGIFNNVGGTLTVTDASITGNEANRAGGGIEDAAGVGFGVTLTNVDLTGNVAGSQTPNPGNGGGLHVTGASDVLIDGGTVAGNSAALEGGGLWNGGGTMTIQNGTLVQNNTASGDAADDGGGGIFNNGGTLVITDDTTSIVGNTADGISGSGGGIFNNVGGTLTVTDASITGNEANRAGGGIEDAAGVGFGVTLTNVDLTGNAAGSQTPNPGNGGGLHVTGASDVLIDGGTVAGNSAALEGGGLWNGGGTMTIQNGTLVESNTASGDEADDGGGGIFNNGGALVITGNATSISGNTADGTSGSGGGIFNNVGGTLTVTDASITINEANRAGGGIEDASGAGLAVTLTGVTLTSNSAGADPAIPNPGNGGGLHVTGAGDVLVDGGIVAGNSAALEGGGLWNGTGTLTLQNGVTIDGNTASGDATDDGGGGVFNNGGTVNVTDGTSIQNNSADGVTSSGGGLLSVSGGVIVVTDSTISGNSTSSDGGGLAAFGIDGAVTLSNAVISSNTAADSGGGVFVDGSTTSVTDSIFTSNLAQGVAATDGAGGGLFVIGGDFTIGNSDFDLNTALGGGGGAEFVDADGSILGGSFTSNTVNGNGITFDTGAGAIAIVGSSRVTAVSIEGVTVTGNIAPAAGGIGIVDSQVSITGTTTISNNQATDVLAGAGGIGALATVPIAGNLLTIGQSIITSNQTAGEGGGIGVIGGDLFIVDSTISGNSANGGRGGGIGIANGANPGGLVALGTTISGNTASVDGGGIALLNSGIDLLNVTVFGNDAQSSGGGIAYDNVNDSVTRSIRFTTISSNTSLSGGSNLSAVGSSIDVTGTIFHNGVCAAAGGVLTSLGFNLDSGATCGFNEDSDQNNTDPLLGPLADNGGGVQTLELLSGSPAIDAGPLSGPATDARGVARPLDGNADGSSLFDIGAFEAESPRMLFVDDVTVDESTGLATVTVLLPVAVGGGLTVDFTTSAVAPTQVTADYTETSGTLTFIGSAGETQTFTVPILEDAVVEPTETILVSLSNPSDITFDVSDTGLVSIDDNDNATVTVSDTTVAEDSGSATVTVTVDNAFQGGFDVDIATVDGSAIAPGDYTATSDTLSFAGTANESFTFTIPIIDDGVDPEVQDFFIQATADEGVARFDGTSGASLGLFVSSGSGGLTTPHNPTFGPDGNLYVASNGTQQILRYDGTTGAFIDVFVDSGEGGFSGTSEQLFDADGTLYVANAAGVFRFDNGGNFIDIIAGPTDGVQQACGIEFGSDGNLYVYDTFDEEMRRFDPLTGNLIDIFIPSGNLTNACDFDFGPDGDIFITDLTFSEIRRFSGADGTFEGVFATTGNGASGITFGPDENFYVNVGGNTHRFDGQTGNFIDVFVPGLGGFGNFAPTPADRITETFDVSLSNVMPAAVIAPPLASIDVTDTGTVTIVDALVVATLFVDDVDVDEAAGIATVTVTLDSTVQGGFTVEIATSDETASQPGDYTASSDVLSFVGDDGESQTFEVPIVNDDVLEALETILVSLSNPSVITVDTSSVGFISIMDDDAAVLTVGDATVNEGDGTVTVSVSVDNAVEGGFSVGFATSDGSAIEPDDYTQTMGTLTFAGIAGEIQTFTIPIVDDALTEGDEQFTVSLADVVTLGNNPAPALSIDASDIGTVTISDTPIDVDLSTSIVGTPDPVLVGGNVTFTVTVSNAGPDAASNSISTTTLPAELSVVTASSTLGSVDITGGVVTVDIGTLAAGIDATITITATAGAIAGPVTVSTAADATGVTTVNASTVTNITAGGGSVIGHIFCDANANQSEDPGEAAGDLTVFLDLNNNGTADLGEPVVLSDVDGDYRFDGVLNTTVDVAVQVIPGCNTFSNSPHVTRTTINVGNLATSIVSFNLDDSDNDRDLVITGDLSGTLTILENNDGVFSVRNTLMDGDRPRSAFSYEPSGGTPLVAVAEIGSGGEAGAVTLLDRQALAGNAFPDSGFAAGDGPIDVIVDDLDGDQQPDVVAGSFRSSDVTVRFGATGEVQTLTTDARQVFGISSGNVDPRTSSAEIVVGGVGYGENDVPRVEVFSMNESGEFVKTVSVASPSSVSILAADVTNDGTDEVLSLSNSGLLTVYRFDEGNLVETIDNEIEGGASSFAIGDFNDDGIADVAIANQDGQFLELFAGNGDGRFARVTTINDISTPTDLVIDDFNGDGFGDIAVTNFLSEVIVGQGPPELALPSTVTILLLDIVTANVVVTSTVVTDFELPTANPEFLFDVSGDGRVSAVDALQVINALNRTHLAEGESSGSAGREKTDVNGDGRTTAVDALMVINHLGRPDSADRIALEFIEANDDVDDDDDELTAAIDLALSQNLI